jgi:hypothetical protein
MPEDIQELKDRLSFFEKQISLYKDDPIKRGYFSLARIVNQQVDYLNSFNLKTEIGSNPKEDKTYDRASSLWEKLPKMISDLNALKIELKISQSDEDSESSRKIPFIDSIADKRP